VKQPTEEDLTKKPANQNPIRPSFIPITNNITMRFSLASITALSALVGPVFAQNGSSNYVRRAQESKCTLFIKVENKGSDGDLTSYACTLASSPHSFLEIEGLSDEFFRGSNIISGKSELEFGTGVTVSSNNVITLNEGTVSVGMSNNPTAQSTTGVKKTLAIRVIAQDAETTFSAGDIKDEIFGTGVDQVNLSERYDTCSYGELTFEPYVGTTSKGMIVDGVAEVTISVDVSGQSSYNIQNAVTTAAAEQIGNLSQEFDYVMLCLPPGTSGGWIAYAYINSYLSVYNDKWCNYPSGQVHEIGHNLGLAHSGESSAYDDQSGMMGYSYSQDEGPRMCFNAAKNRQLGWYDSRTVQINIASEIWEGKITGIANYKDDEITDEKVSVWFNLAGKDYYVSFNSKVGGGDDDMNSGTVEGGNQVLVHQRSQGTGYSVSKLLAKLSANGEYTIQNYKVKVGIIDTSANPPHAFVTIGDENNTAPPVAAPIVSPTDQPVASPIVSPTDQPVAAPIVSPTGQPAEGSEYWFIKKFSVVSKIRRNEKVKSYAKFKLKTTKNNVVENAIIELNYASEAEENDCYFDCSRLTLDHDGTQIGQLGNCGPDCTSGIIADINGVKHPEFYLWDQLYWENHVSYSYDKGPLNVQGANKNMFNRCYNKCFNNQDQTSSQTSRSCTTNAKGKCFISIPAFHPDDVSSVKLNLKNIDVVDSELMYDDMLNQRNSDNCPLFTDDCPSVIIDHNDL